VPATRTLPPLPVSRWIVSAVGLGVFALHALTGQQIISRVTLSAGGIAIAALGVAVVIGHLVRRRPIR